MASEHNNPKTTKALILRPPCDLQMSEDSPRDGELAPGEHTITKYKPKTAKPSLYKVLLLNDDYTPMDFVVHILKKFFNKSNDEAHNIMIQVHNQGSGLAGVFTHEVAETKVYLVNEYSKNKRHPLKCIMEKE